MELWRRDRQRKYLPARNIVNRVIWEIDGPFSVYRGRTCGIDRGDWKQQRQIALDVELGIPLREACLNNVPPERGINRLDLPYGVPVVTGSTLCIWLIDLPPFCWLW